MPVNFVPVIYIDRKNIEISKFLGAKRSIENKLNKI